MKRVVATAVVGCLATLFSVVITPLSAAAVGCDPAALVTALAGPSALNGSGTVTLTAGCTYTMTMVDNSMDGPNAFPDILGDVTVVGNGATITRSTAVGTPDFRFFLVDDGGSLNISNVTLSNGSIASTDLHGGGAILNRSTLTATGVTFANNTSLGSTGGGAIDNHDTGQLTVDGSTFTGNSALQGGGIEDEATLCHTSTPTCGMATVTNSTFTNNSATMFGGGGFESQLNGPTPPVCVGPNQTPACQNPGGAHDTLRGNTFSGNVAMIEGGGIANFGTTTISNSTLYGNSAGSGGGGGVQNTGNISIVQSTLAANNSAFGANIHTFNDTPNQPGPPVTTLGMTIVASGVTGANCSGTNTIIDNGYNLDSGTSCAFSNNSLTNADPMLGPLASNGGLTQTMALQSGSPAIDAIPSVTSGCTGSTDQRGVSRPQGAECEIGAYEVEPPAFAAIYTLDGYGGVHGDNSPAVGITGYWPGWSIARSAQAQPGASSPAGFVLDGLGGLHPYGTGLSESAGSGASHYWSFDIARDFAFLPDGSGGYVLDGYGGLHPFGVNGHAAPVAAQGTPYWAGWDIARKVVIFPDASGGYVLDAYGGIHPFGIGRPAPAATSSLATTGYWTWQAAKDIVLIPGNGGYSGYVLDAFGGLHPFHPTGDGSVMPAAIATSYFGFNIARGVFFLPG